MKLFYKLFGDPNKKLIKSLNPIIQKINDLENDFKIKSEEDFKILTQNFIANYQKIWNKIKNLETEKKKKQTEEYLESILPQAFAAVREASSRVLGQRHYDVQLIGGIILHRGQIAEMKTGEGKTLVATLPIYLNALSGRGAHLITVNDYLSRVGAGWMAPVYYFLGLTTAVIVHDAAYIYDPDYNDENQFDLRLKHLKPVSRQEAYHAHILYGTNNEFGFDYLRDNMAPDANYLVQRDLYYAIVDEVDSILIDEARTPLIISAPTQEATDKYYKFAKLVAQLEKDLDYNVDEKLRAVTLNDAGIARMEKFLGVDNIYTTGGIQEVHHIEQALKAHVLFKKDRDYVVREGEIIIVDEFTGRLMFGRRYSDGLHQAIEAKENVDIQKESETLATVTFQNYFRLYEKLAGMTGTAMTEAEEFYKIYKLETVAIPTHRPVLRQDFNDFIYASEDGKFKAVITEIKECHKRGQPILIGTVSIEKNEKLAHAMELEGLRPQILNAKNHEREAQIISNAGKVGAITLATNMAGRGVDIVLGGVEPERDTAEHDAWQEEHDKVLKLGGLHVIGTERHEARRIDNQLRGRAGRQGDPGSSRFYLSTEDDLMRIFGGDRMKRIMTTLRVPEHTPIENKIISRSIESAQKRVEGNNFDIRKHLVEYDDVLNKHRETIYKKRQTILRANTLNENQHPDTGIGDMIPSEIASLTYFHTLDVSTKQWNIKEIQETSAAIFGKNIYDDSKIDGILTSKNHERTRETLVEYLTATARNFYTETRQAGINTGINWNHLEKNLSLRAIDAMWIEHLNTIAHLRQGINLRGYGQHDPLVEYKKEAYRLFKELEDAIQKEIVYNIFKIGAAEAIMASNLLERAIQFSAPTKVVENQIPSAKMPFAAITSDTLNPSSHIQPKVGRNNLCPCGSGKKYKKCHGA